MNHEPTELHALIHACLDGRATADEAARLNALLRADATARDVYLQLADIHSCLAIDENLWAVASTAEQRAHLGTARTHSGFSWLSWRPLTAAAAGIVLGMFCTSVVMAYMAPSAGEAVTLISDGFEDGASQWSHGFPNQTGVWGGDVGEVVSGNSEVQPLEGQHMARLDPSPTATLSYLDRIVDVRSLPVPQGNELRQVTVTASFHSAERGLRDRYTLRVAAFADAPAHWVGREWKEIEGALAASKRGLSTTADAEGWQTLTAIVEVPREARSLVISLASGLSQNPDRKTAHYIDGVEATLSFGAHPAKTKTKRFNLTAK